MEDGSCKKLMEDNKMSGSKFYYGASHGKLIDEFYRSLETGNRTYVKVSDAKMSIALIDAIQMAGKTGNYVTI